MTHELDRGRPVDGQVDIIDVAFCHGVVRLHSHPGRPAWLYVAVIAPGQEPVVVCDHEMPAPAQSFELRGPGVWIELAEETALDHWTVGLEAFGVQVPFGTAVDPDTRGDRVPVGLDLDLDTIDPGPQVLDQELLIPVRVHGEMLFADARWEVDCRGIRRRGPAVVASPVRPDQRAVGWNRPDGSTEWWPRLPVV